MMRYLVMGVIFSLFLLSGCDQGLTPPDLTPSLIEFPVMPEGGNPVGTWIPHATNPIEVILLDEFPVDSVVFKSELNGIISLEITGICSVNAVVSFRPLIYNLGQVLEFDTTLTDTLWGNGPYDIIADNILLLPIESNVINFDTLGYTSQQSRLDLITLPTVFVFEDMISFRFFAIIHLTRQNGPLQRKSDFLVTLGNKEEG